MFLNFKKSVKAKIFYIFTGVVILLILTSVIFNMCFLETFYVYKNNDAFSELTKKIMNYSGDNINEFIEDLDKSDGVSITIADFDLVIKNISYPKKKDSDLDKVPKEIGQAIKSGYFEKGRILESAENETPKLVYISKSPNNEYIILSKQMKGIRDSVSIANQFFVFAGMIVVIIGGIFIFFVSRKISNIIVRMSQVSEKIAELDFSQKIDTTTQDEIGMLGESINTISEKLKKSIGELRADIERRKVLVRDISHELKTPIGVIKGYTEGLKYGVAENNKQREKYCDIIANECDKMDDMVKEMLKFSLLESGKQELDLRNFKVCELLYNIKDRYEKQIEDNKIEFIIDCPTALSIFADYSLMERAINNLVVNAIKYTDKIIIVKATKNEISVYNTGSHIPDEEINKIWDVFYKIDKARTRNLNGHGLGLAIVKSIADAHNFAVSAENATDGIVFKIIM